MIIDFHTHIFPDSVAPKGLAVLIANCNNAYLPVTDMTLSGLLGDMDKSGVNLSVVQPVITRPTQFKNLNDFAASVTSGKVISFGALHHLTDDYKRDIDYIISLGLKGIKFHAEYQSFVVDDAKMLRIYDYAINKGLILLHHAGYDPIGKPPFLSNPQRFARVVKELKGGTIIAAHLGGHDQWDDVERYLVGTDIYLDTSMSVGFTSREQFIRIVKAHGAHKILFGSDSPWGSPTKDMADINAMPLTQQEKQDILGNNAAKLLGYS